MKAHWGGGGKGLAPFILFLDTRWRWVVNFMTRPLGKNTDSHWTGSWVVLTAFTEYRFPVQGLKTRTLQPVASRSTDCTKPDVRQGNKFAIGRKGFCSWQRTTTFWSALAPNEPFTGWISRVVFPRLKLPTDESGHWPWCNDDIEYGMSPVRLRQRFSNFFPSRNPWNSCPYTEETFPIKMGCGWGI